MKLKLIKVTESSDELIAPKVNELLSKIRAEYLLNISFVNGRLKDKNKTYFVTCFITYKER